MNNLMSTVGIRTDGVENKNARKLCGVKKLLENCIDKIFLRWYSHVGCLENGRLVKMYCIVA